MKALKFLAIAFVLFVILLVVGVFIGLSQIDSLAKAAVEKGGSHALGVKTTLTKADIGLFSGKFAIEGLGVANPSGFKSPSFLTLGKGGVDLSLDSLGKPVIDVPRFALSEVRVSLERKDGKANYQAILDNLKKLQGQSPSGPQDKPQGKPTPEGESKKFIVREVDIRDVKIDVDLLGLGGDASRVTIPIDSVKLNNIGTADGAGVDIARLSSIIVQAILAAAAEKGGGLIPADLLNDLQGQLAQLDGLKQVGVEVIGKAGEAAQKLGSQVQKVGEEAAKKVEETVGKAADDAAKKVEQGINDAGKKVEEGIKGLIPGLKTPKKEPKKEPESKP